MSCKTNRLGCIATTVGVLACSTVPAVAGQRSSGIIYRSIVTVLGDHPLATFDPARAWGAGLDGHELRDVLHSYTAGNVAAMLSAGFGPITYRLRTELAIATWHWNPAGRWSDSAHHQGYWISDDHSAQPIGITFGYRLPRRGRTIDDAANDGYSRLDDGDTTSFWKSNPYLDARFTHDDEREHAQWIVIDLGHAVPIDVIRIFWGDPYPRRYIVEYWTGDQGVPIDYNPDGEWRAFDHGAITALGGGLVQLRLASKPVKVRSLRIVMYQSSHTAPRGTSDPRDSLGFAVREVFAGTFDSRHLFHDQIRHDSIAAAQTAMLVSSTDPWHRAVDQDTGIAQPSFDMVVRSGLARGLPMLVPTGLLFDTPENAAAEIRFLRNRGYPLQGIELGEEPDGQRVTPEDYGALYTQFASAVHAADPGVMLGGTSMQNLRNDPLRLWPYRQVPGRRSTWLGRFLDYLDSHHRASDFRFFSFEWYPFDDVCADPALNLAAAPGKLDRDLARLRLAGLPDSIPRIMTEYGYSAHISTAEVTLPGALFDADLVANFFTHGGSRSFYFGYEPGRLSHEASCEHWGNLLMLLADSAGQVRDRLPRYYAARLLARAWADSNGGSHASHAVRIDPRREVDTLLSTFALHRPDGRWSVLLVNRDPRRTRLVEVRVDIGNRAGVRALRGPIDVWQYSEQQYQFQEDHARGHPGRDLPPTHEVDAASRPVTVPPYSITVITGW